MPKELSRTSISIQAQLSRRQCHPGADLTLLDIASPKRLCPQFKFCVRSVSKSQNYRITKNNEHKIRGNDQKINNTVSHMLQKSKEQWHYVEIP